MRNKFLVFLVTMSIIATLIPSAVAYATNTGSNTSGAANGIDLPLDRLDDEGVASGDVNGDNKLNSDDAIYLLMHIKFPTTYKVDIPADFTRDGKIDSNDAIFLLMHVQFPNDEKYTLNPLTIDNTQSSVQLPTVKIK